MLLLNWACELSRGQRLMNGLESTKHSIGNVMSSCRAVGTLLGWSVALDRQYPPHKSLPFLPPQAPPLPVCWDWMCSADVCASWSCSVARGGGGLSSWEKLIEQYCSHWVLWSATVGRVRALSSPCPLSPGEQRSALLFPGRQNVKLSLQWTTPALLLLESLNVLSLSCPAVVRWVWLLFVACMLPFLDWDLSLGVG